MSSHKPRRRRNPDDSYHGRLNNGSVEIDPASKEQRPAFPLAAFLWPARGTVSQWTLLPLILMVAGLFRWVSGFWGYSGFESPPMYGDFEAQRHWMEITTHLPVSKWYFYDLQWWGLDYPPLTAYHSWLLGQIGRLIEPSWFALDTSRGLDDPSLKVYMRGTVIASEYLVYIPAAVIFVRRFVRIEGVNTWEASVALVAILMQPATILIDHAHFQYNTVMLGFVLASMAAMLAGRYMWSCFFFVSALGFKQMALFYAPAVFAYLLGVCLIPKVDIGRFLNIAFATVLSFAILFTPLLLGVLYDWYRGTPLGDLPQPPLLSNLPINISEKAWYYPYVLQMTQSVHRIFPFARGLFEDKVANIWCAIHTFHKLHVYQATLLQRAALVATLAAILPPCLILFLRPRKELLPLGFATTAWAFFLCSYQVHEKNDLLPLLPMTLQLAGEAGLMPATRAWVGLANMVGVWTLFPLLKRDVLRVPYFVLILLWAYLMGLPPTSLSAYSTSGEDALNVPEKAMHLALYVAMTLWHVGEAFVKPPADKPDLWVVLNVLIGTAGFGLCYLWCLWSLLKKSELLGMLGTPSQGQSKPQKKTQ